MTERARQDPNRIDLLELARSGPIHFMGVAGAGVSALAELVVRSGGKATGCDLRPGPVGEALRGMGMPVWQGHDAGHVQDAVAVVATAAVPGDHAELAAARARGVPVLKRAAALGSVVQSGRVLAVSGTHGKTTTTAMTAAILEAAGMDPTAFVGGHVPGWTGGLRVGARRWFVVEADEFDRSFLELQPEAAVVTSVEADHLDVFGSMAAVEDAFVEFLSAVPADGRIVGCADDAGVRRILPRLPSDRVLGYGLGGDARLRAVDVRRTDDGAVFTAQQDGEDLGSITLRVPGLHNVRNALGALALARHAGASMEHARSALAAFPGVVRRFQVLGHVAGVTVVDDYAHHPTEIAATLSAARERFPDRRLIAVFQPHLYSRTRDLHDDLGRALAAADVVWVSDVYPARERPIAGVSGALVADAATAADAAATYVAHPAAMTGAVLEMLEAGDVCVTLGAGDIDLVARALLQGLREREGGSR
jgi:UDP-N-acetylmuramate--alanine ligase